MHDLSIGRSVSLKPLIETATCRRFSIATAVVGIFGSWPSCQRRKQLRVSLITLTGTQSGPATFNGQAGAGTLIRFGDDSNECGTVKLLVDAGRGTNMRLSQFNVTPVQLNAIFFTHMHSDHTEGFADICSTAGPGI